MEDEVYLESSGTSGMEQKAVALCVESDCVPLIDTKKHSVLRPPKANMSRSSDKIMKKLFVNPYLDVDLCQGIHESKIFQ